MPTFNISPLYKQNAFDTETFTLDDDGNVIEICRKICWRWATVVVDADQAAIEAIDVNNANGFNPTDELEVIDYSTEYGCWEEWQFPDSMSEEERQNIEALVDENGVCALEEVGWLSGGVETIFTGPLRIEDESGNVIAEGQSEESVDLYLSEAVIIDDYAKTNWYPVSMNPVHIGVYEAEVLPWPFPKLLDWDGEHWRDSDGELVDSTSIVQWRGLKSPV